MESNISSRMVQAPSCYFLTFNFIFKVKLWAFYLVCEYIVKGER